MVAIVAAGMVTSLGTDIHSSCAAARAGLSRARSLPQFLMRSEIDGRKEPVIGHQVPMLTDGFTGVTRLARLLSGAFKDLLRNRPGLDRVPGEVALYLSLPDPARAYSGAEIVLSDIRRDALLALLANESAPSADPEDEDELIRQALLACGWLSPPRLASISYAGNAGGVEMLDRARRDIERGAVTLAVVAGVDSWLDEAPIAWLQDCGRLKNDGSPVGLRPGESAVAIALAADGAGYPPIARLVASATATEPRHLLSGQVSVGDGIAELVDRLAEPAAPSARPTWIIADLNGEVHRSNEFGFAVTKIRERHAFFADYDVWFPAMSFGDTGAASALVAVGVCIQAFSRGYEADATAWIYSASDGPARGAMRVTGHP